MINMLKKILNELNLKFTIKENASDQYISLTYEKEDIFNELIRYNVLIFADVSVNAVSFYVPAIYPIGNRDNKTIDLTVLKEKIEYINEKNLYGMLTVKNNREVVYDYSFVFIDNHEYLKEVMVVIFDYIDFIVYEVGLLTNPYISLHEFISIRE